MKGDDQIKVETFTKYNYEVSEENIIRLRDKANLNFYLGVEPTSFFSKRTKRLKPKISGRNTVGPRSSVLQIKCFSQTCLNRDALGPNRLSFSKN